MTDKRCLSKEAARRFLIGYQGLDGGSGYQGQAGVAAYIAKVGCIQYDPLQVVGRNADLVLQSRVQDYTPALLEKLLYQDRTLIDGWDKMMAIYVSCDWPYFKRPRRQMGMEIKRVLEHRHSSEALDHLEEVLEAVAKDGPLQASQIDLGTSSPGSWGHKRLSSAALDYLYHVGRLGVHSKRGAQKVYDVVERLLPQEIVDKPDPFASDEDFYQWYVARRIGSVGLLWEKNAGGWLGQFLSDKKIRHDALQSLLSQEKIVECFVEGIRAPFYIRKQDLSNLDCEPAKDYICFLAPLDNLLWDRDLIKTLFGFTYSWEVYLPVEKRKYGYYVLPVLYNDRFVARFEPELYRGEPQLRIKNWWWEPEARLDGALLTALEQAFHRFCGYLGCGQAPVDGLMDQCVRAYRAGGGKE